jgi:hypothetical protein
VSAQDNELDIGPAAFPRDSWKNDVADAFMDAIDLASDQDTVTWLTEDGKRVAAIVPVDMAEHLHAIPSAVQALLRRP